MPRSSKKKTENIKNMDKRLKKIESKTIIVHLPIDLTDIQNYKHNDFCQKKNNTEDNFNPQSYNLQLQNTHHCITHKLPTNEPNRRFKFCSEGQTFEKRITKPISDQYYESTNPKNNKCSLHCWHCSREILWTPSALPVKFENEKFSVKGFFCTLNCALTFNFYSAESESVIQEREGFIHMMHNLCYPHCTEKLNYAPPREALKMYGGTLSYEEFHQNNKIVNILHVPKVPLLCSIEENIPVTMS